MNVLVIGGAGYIGSHVVRLLEQRGDEVVVVDNFSTGFRDNVKKHPIVELDVSAAGAREVLAATMRKYQITHVIHFAALKNVGDSVVEPVHYYAVNVGGFTNILGAMDDAGVDKLVFSSSAATYGMPDLPKVPEDVDMRPINPYGETKLINEWQMRDQMRATGLRGVALRYFNVAGAGWKDLGDRATLNLIPLVLRALDHGQKPKIYGDDYDTPDGTGVRDYVHVLDLAEAHIAALSYLDQDERRHDTFNVGTEVGTSVKQILAEIAKARGLDDPTCGAEVTPRRAGDPPNLVGATDLIREELDWKAEHNVEDIIKSAVEAWVPRD